MFDLQGTRVLVLIPHQDDEVIGMGGAIAKACREADSVDVVLITDGAATGSVKPLCGLRPCSRFSDLLDHPDFKKHDESLIERDDGALYHSENFAHLFDVREDNERAGSFGSVAWGKQRDREFRAVCRELGVKQENIVLAYWDPKSPHRIKDGQVAIEGRALSNDERKARYREVAEHYISGFQPDMIYTMAPYEFSEPPNDHWAVAKGVGEASTEIGTAQVLYFHSGRHYIHVRDGGKPIGETLELDDEIWQVKQRAIENYLRWDPENGWFATAPHSVAAVFSTLLLGYGQREYYS